MSELKIKGEVYKDTLTRALYATDASMYQIFPDIVVVPKDEEDLAIICHYARAHKLPILPRGSATSLAGQTVNRGIVIDFTKYFNKVLSYNATEGTAVVQPGVTRDQLNLIVEKDNFHYAPDPATSNRATFGGMIANNSSGTKSILYGKTSDYVISLKIMLIDGTILTLQDCDHNVFDTICNQNDSEGDLYRKIRSIIFNNIEEIKERYPKVMRRVTGYALDAFQPEKPWNLSKLITGSEGSLAIILEAKIGLVPLPKFQNLAVAHFEDRNKGIQAVKQIVSFGPAAVEVLDDNVLVQSKSNAITKKYHDNLIKGDPALVLTVEFYGDTQEEITSKANQLTAYLENYPTAYHCPVFYDKASINDALNLRKDGLGILMGKVADKKPQAFVEDSAIPLEHLADYIETVENICKEQETELVIYAHASVGVLHIRPILDVTKTEDIEKMKYISDQCFQLVKKYGGSWSGEHGDGRNRGPRIRDFYGDQIYDAFKQVKNAFDPYHLLNPNIIIDTPPMDQHMRYGPEYTDQKQQFVFHYRKDHSFEDLVHMCSGVGACRKTVGGTMCPSFRATGDEKDSTRGRANTLRLAMSGQMNFKDLSHPDVKEVMDLCLSCKACKSECPSNVDMAKLKSEVLQISYDAHGSSLAEKLPKYAPTIAKWSSGLMAPIVNKIQKFTFFKKILAKYGGIHSQRNLPEYSNQKLTNWYKRQEQFKSQRKVVLFADTYINHHEIQLGKHAIQLLNDCGYEVILAEVGCCQRPLISNGFLKEAKVAGTKTAMGLYEYIKTGTPILVLEPSCFSSLSEDLPDLIDDADVAKLLHQGVFQIEDFLTQEWVSGKLDGKFSAINDQPIVIHGHCHQKALQGMTAIEHLLNLASIPYEILDTGCCGMAGAFGYEKNHYEISVKIANESLIPALKRHPEAGVFANGFSCRHQIEDLAHRSSKHIIEQIKFSKNG
ncbi:MAG TPA: FAD-linked oxidase C-terminal domain-containing protein [Saprospiraceae bacterium]|nr:FAD-linked oxidase C-terminal domain-containing protein [Saprospiraceae bacterium]HPN71521.1 FAD-linked oxidase C-terminal domain-containing protein [Saprospiraceae bacterium]